MVIWVHNLLFLGRRMLSSGLTLCTWLHPHRCSCSEIQRPVEWHRSNQSTSITNLNGYRISGRATRIKGNWRLNQVGHIAVITYIFVFSKLVMIEVIRVSISKTNAFSPPLSDIQIFLFFYLISWLWVLLSVFMLLTQYCLVMFKQLSLLRFFSSRFLHFGLRLLTKPYQELTIFRNNKALELKLWVPLKVMVHHQGPLLLWKMNLIIFLSLFMASWQGMYELMITQDFSSW